MTIATARRSADDWDTQLLYFLREGYRDDRRGHGRSSHVSEGHDMEASSNGDNPDRKGVHWPPDARSLRTPEPLVSLQIRLRRKT
jgi:hypothetical protein